VADSALGHHLSAEQSTAVRRLLAQPLIDAESDPDAFRVIARHIGWLTEYFEKTCGWLLTVDIASGYARLAKRSAPASPSPPLRRTRGSGAPFDRRRYQLLCLVSAELVRHPVTTMGLLAGAVTADASLDTSRHGERTAFVDALRALMAWGVVRATAGDVEAFVGSEQGNAILTADTARLHRLLASTSAPSALDPGLTTDEAAQRLAAEPRYGDGQQQADEGEEARNRRARHMLARRVLDQPVSYADELGSAEAAYLASPSGRRWLRERVAEAGLELEERAEGLLAVDPDSIATDRHFPAPMGNAHQLALLLADRLVTTEPTGHRRLARLSARQLDDEVERVFRRFPSWARGQRDAEGPARLAREAVDLLVSFGLVRRDADGAIEARPALARYRVSEPVLSSTTPSLFEEAL
jgi:uncharacterized protein (TIGR02678 family)